MRLDTSLGTKDDYVEKSPRPCIIWHSFCSWNVRGWARLSRCVKLKVGCRVWHYQEQAGCLLGNAWEMILDPGSSGGQRLTTPLAKAKETWAPRLDGGSNIYSYIESYHSTMIYRILPVICAAGRGTATWPTTWLSQASAVVAACGLLWQNMTEWTHEPRRWHSNHTGDLGESTGWRWSEPQVIGWGFRRAAIFLQHEKTSKTLELCFAPHRLFTEAA